MAKVVAMGEILLRLSTPGYQKFIQANEFDVCYGGGEANVAVSLANYGHTAEFITKVPANPIGECAVAALRKMNVETKHIARGGERLGIYFLETGTAMRASNVVYDRANSSIATADPEDFDFDEIFEGADCFHFTGITPAVSDKAAILTKAALEAARKNGVTVTCDYNYRQKLWTREKAVETMSEFMPYVDIFFGGIDDACGLLGRTRRESDTMETAFAELAEKYDFRYIFATNRISHSASDNTISAYAYSAEDKALYSSRAYRVHPIADRVGGGDAFTGAAVCGILDGKSLCETIEFGIAASALKHTIPGDMNLVSRDEVDKLVGGDGSGRVQR